MERGHHLSKRVLCLETYIQLRSNRELYLENCRRIVEYNDIRIVIQTTDLTLEIWGSGLEADSRSPECLVIHGDIQALNLKAKGKNT
ncbi:YabP/YqfC family sporulation protein [uncultured Ruminococcus sp.]|uniref:YabP/YqfC family sporulation protein n=1 Tax=uncultured Ruminococcus sp. TaxID=165186 RepID=UPI0025FA3F6A|nr:YabP/YqfC family sporulation protein [uncultured Ruminococcus sp.]